MENFELPNKTGDPFGCRIFGHICPVFKVAEPFTETKTLRNISRVIPKPTQFRVLRRDNYICQKCKKPIDDNHINFDHIIPWSKGGSSEESNIRILCESCNKARGNSFEDEYLVLNYSENFYEPRKIVPTMVFDLLRLFAVTLAINKYLGSLDMETFCSVIETSDIDTDVFMFNLISEIWELFSEDKFFIPIKKKERILRFRWGLIDGNVHNIESVCSRYKIEKEYFMNLEDLLLRQIGFVLSPQCQNDKNYLLYAINSDEINQVVKQRLIELSIIKN